MMIEMVDEDYVHQTILNNNSDAEFAGDREAERDMAVAEVVEEKVGVARKEDVEEQGVVRVEEVKVMVDERVVGMTVMVKEEGENKVVKTGVTTERVKMEVKSVVEEEIHPLDFDNMRALPGDTG